MMTDAVNHCEFDLPSLDACVGQNMLLRAFAIQVAVGDVSSMIITLTNLKHEPP